jgi:predicted ATPase/DNA-binding winged helix-turn-helix (wHTH) protein
LQEPAARPEAGRKFNFGAFQLDVLERQIKGPTGVVVLSSRACDLLAALLLRPGELVTKDQLMRALWPNTIVEDNNLHVHVSALRKALGPGLIRTVSGRGYRYVGSPPVSDAIPAPFASDEAIPIVDSVLGIKGNLSTFLPPLIGREIDLTDLRCLVQQQRLVSLVGPGGIGKTRLALAVGKELQHEFRDGVWVVDLAPILDPILTVGTIAKAFSITLQSGSSPLEQLVDELRDRKLLLILDNCEYLVSAIAAFVPGLLASAPHIHVLATSQEPLAATGEHVFRLSPLDLPLRNANSAASIGATGAVRLFVDRVGTFDRHFRLTDSNAPHVAEICARLDGIPLALEMASGLASSLGLVAIHQALEARFELPAADRHSALARHRTLGAMLDWSHSLLSPHQQILFRRLAVFSTSFTIESAQQIAGAEPLYSVKVIRLLSELVERSLVVRQGWDEARFRLLETMRAYSQLRLQDAGETATLRQAHAIYFLERLEQGIREWNTTPDSAWLEKYGLDLEDARSALRWAEVQQDAGIYLRLVGSFYRLWLESGLIEEAVGISEQALKRLPEAGDAETEARLRLAAAEVANASASQRTALEVVEPAIELFRHLRSKTGLCAALHRAGFALACLQRREAAKRHLAEALQILADNPPSKLSARVRMAFGLNLLSVGDSDRGHRICENALRIHRELGDDRGRLKSIMYLAEFSFHSGDYGRAVSLGEELVAELRQTQARLDLAGATSNLTTYHLFIGNLGQAEVLLKDSFELLVQSTSSWRWCCFLNTALILAMKGDYLLAARVTGYVDHCFESAGVFRQLTEQLAHQRITSILAECAPNLDLPVSFADGASWTADQADRAVGFGRPIL